MGRVENKTAIVTGSAQGIGATYATALTREGARVDLVDNLDPSPMAATIREIGGQALGIHADISATVAVDDMVRQTVDAFGHIDILINNPAILGSLKMQSFLDISVAKWDQLMRVKFPLVTPGASIHDNARRGVVYNQSRGRQNHTVPRVVRRMRTSSGRESLLTGQFLRGPSSTVGAWPIGRDPRLHAVRIVVHRSFLLILKRRIDLIFERLAGKKPAHIFEHVIERLGNVDIRVVGRAVRRDDHIRRMPER